MNANPAALASETNPAELDLACELLHRFFSAALGDPGRTSSAILQEPLSRELARQAADVLRAAYRSVPIERGFGEAPIEDLDLRPVLKRPIGEERLAAEHVRVFGLGNCRECPPYETEYHRGDDPFFRSQQMADIAGFYRAYGLAPGAQARERPDYIALELEFMALLYLKQREADANSEEALVCASARRAFLLDHVCWWMPAFALALRHKAEGGFYEGVGRALAALLPIERHRHGIEASLMPLQANVGEPEPKAACAGCLLASH